jgi:hypothetical protein
VIARRICATCGKFLGYKDVAPMPGITDPVTHGMCEECEAKAYRELAGWVLDGRATLVTGGKK